MTSRHSIHAVPSYRRTVTVLPRSETPSEIIRASGISTCDVCGKPYADHPRNVYTDDVDRDNYPLVLAKLCDGRLRKL